MTLKLCLALAFAGAPVVLPASDPVYVHMDAVKQVDCEFTRGTAFRVGSGAFVTAAHVVDDINCEIEGEPITITHLDAVHDFATLRTGKSGIPLKINCEGFKDGEEYRATGYAEGKPIQRQLTVTASDAWTLVAPWKGFYTLIGEIAFIPGMSGGIVQSVRTGEIVGVVNGYNSLLPLSYSQPLSETALCQNLGQV